MKIKICGMRRIEDIQMINRYPVDYAGMIFYPKSFRYIQPEKAKELVSHLKIAKSVGVFVNESIETVIQITDLVNLKVIQLHGNEDQSYINELKKQCSCEIWKAIRVKDPADLELLKLKNVDYFLLDSFTQEYGGSGKSFNHQLIENINLDHCLIAGGINQNNIQSIIKYHPYGIDISSGIETEQYKDENKLRQLLEELQ